MPFLKPCKRCNSPEHSSRECKVTFRKAWPNQNSTQAKIRFKDGSMLTVERTLTDEAAKKIVSILMTGDPDSKD